MHVTGAIQCAGGVDARRMEREEEKKRKSKGRPVIFYELQLSEAAYDSTTSPYYAPYEEAILQSGAEERLGVGNGALAVSVYSYYYFNNQHP